MTQQNDQKSCSVLVHYGLGIQAIDWQPVVAAVECSLPRRHYWLKITQPCNRLWRAKYGQSLSLRLDRTKGDYRFDLINQKLPSQRGTGHAGVSAGFVRGNFSEWRTVLVAVTAMAHTPLTTAASATAGQRKAAVPALRTLLMH